MTNDGIQANGQIKGKRKARRSALQALYQWHMNHDDVHHIEAQYRVVINHANTDVDYFSLLFHGVISHLDEINSAFTPYIDRTLEELTPIELAVLRLSTYELIYCLDIPYKIILDESVNLCKEFGTSDGYKYVNGVLNAVAKKIRIHE